MTDEMKMTSSSRRDVEVVEAITGEAA